MPTNTNAGDHLCSYPCVPSFFSHRGILNRIFAVVYHIFTRLSYIYHKLAQLSLSCMPKGHKRMVIPYWQCSVICDVITRRYKYTWIIFNMQETESIYFRAIFSRSTSFKDRRCGDVSLHLMRAPNAFLWCCPLTDVAILWSFMHNLLWNLDDSFVIKSITYVKPLQEDLFPSHVYHIELKRLYEFNFPSQPYTYIITII